MRKIETQMNNAIEQGINWHSSNTVVTFDQESGESSVYLHTTTLLQSVKDSCSYMMVVGSPIQLRVVLMRS